MEAELARPLFDAIRLLPQKPQDRIFVEIGLVIDIWDFESDRWPLSALLQVSKFYDCAPEEVLQKYEVIVTPFLVHHGSVFAGRLVSV